MKRRKIKREDIYLTAKASISVVSNCASISSASGRRIKEKGSTSSDIFVKRIAVKNEQ